MTENNRWKKLAGIVRIVTVPPVVILLLLIILFVLKQNIFRNIGEFVVSAMLLMVIPILAYPISMILPNLRSKGRDGQRSLAIHMTFVSYGVAVAYGLIFSVSNSLLLIYFTYFVSVVMLEVSNRMIRFRASGHACSITGPLVLMIYFVGWSSVIPCVLLLGMVIWASLLLKRHTLKELLAGSGVAAVSFGISLLLQMGVFLL